MAQQRKSRKADKFKATKRMKTVMQLRHFRKNYQFVANQLQNLDRCFAIERITNPTIKQEQYAKLLLERQEKLLTSIVDLEATLAKARESLSEVYRTPIIVNFPPKGNGQVELTLEGLLDLLRQRSDIHVFPSCESLRGIAVLEAMHECEMLGPYLPSSQARDGFTQIESAGLLSVSFVNQRLSSTGSDSMQSRRIFDFKLPAMPCNGSVTFRFAGSLTTTPNISAENGCVESEIRFLIHKKGDAIDPLDDSVGWYLAARTSESVNASSGDWGDRFPKQDSFNHSCAMAVRKRDVPMFHYSVINTMHVSGGVASFEEEGGYTARAEFRLPSGYISDVFGIVWEFQPDG